MIKLTRLNQNPLILNSELIEHIDATPDTVVSLTSGHKFLVAETPEEIIDRIIAFRKRIVGPGVNGGSGRNEGTTWASHGNQ